METPDDPSPPADAAGDRQAHSGPTGRRDLATLALAALGVVYGDIGTSVLYTVRESFHFYGLAPSHDNVVGVLSLIVWSLILIISVKYAVFVLRADNRGEGGILALTALVTPVGATRRGGRRALILLGLFGTALLYGDGMLTPAVTVLSAVEGLEVATPFFAPYVLPIAVVILLLLFAVQRFGTAGIGRAFGPITLVWFATISIMGLSWIVRVPHVLVAFWPGYAIDFFRINGWHGFLVLGSVFLAVTGGEALYADMGHFGRRPIRLAWYTIVLPALVLNYLGQGAFLLATPEGVANPFFRMAPAWMVLPLVGIATMAAVIASQALITGAFSLTMQAVQLGYLPRMEIQHTSARQRGQIYIPAINWLLLLCCVGLVLGFRSSSNLAAAYGVAVTTTMVVTTLLMAVVERERFRWGWGAVIAFSGIFLAIDLAFWGANIIKVPHGGWFPLVVGAVVFLLMTTWKKGRQLLASRLAESSLPWEFFVNDMRMTPPKRVPGTAVFMYGNPEGTPPALLHSLKHYGVLHERVVLMTIETAETPHVDPAERRELEVLGKGFYRLVLRYGFMEEPSPAVDMASIRVDGLNLNPMKVSFFLGRETLIPSRQRKMTFWREHIFAAMARNARTATSFFGLPPNRVIELGAQIEL